MGLILILILSIIAVAILVFLAVAELQHLINKLFHITASTFPRVVWIMALASVAPLVISGIGFLLNAVIFKLFAVLGSYIVGAVLYRKYLQTNFWKSVLVLFIGNIAAFLLLVIVVVLLRGFLFAPFLVDGDSMAPAYPSGEYIVIEKVDKSVSVGNVVIATVQDAQGAYYVIARVAGVSGNVVNGITVPQGDIYLTKDNPTSTSTYMVSESAIVGKPVLDLGKTNW